MPSLGNSNDLTVRIDTEADTQAVTMAEEKLQSFRKAANNLADSLGASNKETEKAGENVGKVGEEAGKATPKSHGFAGAMKNIADQVRTVGSYIAGYQLIEFFKTFANEALGGAAELEQINIAFQGLIGNAQEANTVFGQLAQYANVTPFESKDIVSAARTLMGFGTAGQQTVDIIKQLGDVVAAGGGDMQALALVTGQVFAQGKMRAQDMYQVINDGGAGLIKIMAQNAGGMQKLTEQFDKGGIPAKAYFDAITQATSQGGFAFQGANKQAETFNGRISTLKDAIQQFAMKLVGVKIDPQLGLVIQPGGLFDKAKGFIDNMTVALQKLGENKTAIIAIAGALGGVFLGTLLAIAVAIGWIPLAIIAVTAAVGAAVAVIVSKWKEWHNQILILGVVLFGIVAIAVAVAALIITHWQQVKDSFKHVWSDITQWATDTWRAVQGAAQTAGNFIIGIWNWELSVAKRVFEAIGGAFKAVYDTAIKPVVNFMAEGWRIQMAVATYVFDVIRGLALVTWWFIYNNVVKPVTEAIKLALIAIGDAASASWNWISNQAMRAWNFLYGTVIKPVLDAVAAAAKATGEAITAVWNWELGIARSVWSAIVDAVKWAGGEVMAIWHPIATWFSDMWHKLTSAAGTAGNGISSLFSRIANDIKQAFKDALNWVIDRINGLVHALNNTVGKLPGVPKLADVPHFATGVQNFAGGWAIVGDMAGGGGELVKLPPGANVYTNTQSQSMMPQTRPVQITNNNTFYTPYDPTIFAQELGFRLSHA